MQSNTTLIKLAFDSCNTNNILILKPFKALFPIDNDIYENSSHIINEVKMHKNNKD